VPVDPQEERQPESSSRLLRDDTRFATGRIAVFQYITVAVFLFLIEGFWALQVRDYEANSELAERNRIRTVPLSAPRGKILDRDNRVIVDNQPSFSVVLAMENLNKDHLAGIAEGLHLDLEDLQTKVKRSESSRKYDPIRLKSDLTPAELAFVESNSDLHTFPELEVTPTPRRLYPQGGLGAHVIGYVGEVSDVDLNSSDFAKQSQGDIVGKFGLERQYNDILMGVDGQRRVERDSAGRVRRVLESVEATPGRTLHTTLDLDLQAVAELALDGRKGAVVALDPRTGEVLAMVSRPTFDPGMFTGHISVQKWKDVIEDPDDPLMNRAIQAQFSPGSTFKPIVALAGLESGALEASTTFHCAGGETFAGGYHKCDAIHGTIDLHHAIVKSCDVYFYNAGTRMGIDTIAQYGQMAGLGKKTGIDLPGEKEGLLPSTRWKLRAKREKWYEGDTVSASIGQGYVTVTPIQLAVAIGGLAMGGVWHRPHLVKEESGAEVPRQGELHPENIATVVSGMLGVVNEGGTGAAAQIAGIELAGKTGTAQQISNAAAKSNKALALSMKDNAWFVGFAPAQHPEIVVVALWESSGEHGAQAAPIVRDIIKAYFDKKARPSNPQLRQIALFRRPGA
jgi:penicillin-binding protein 2